MPRCRGNDGRRIDDEVADKPGRLNCRRCWKFWGAEEQQHALRSRSALPLQGCSDRLAVCAFRRSLQAPTTSKRIGQALVWQPGPPLQSRRCNERGTDTWVLLEGDLQNDSERTPMRPLTLHGCSFRRRKQQNGHVRNWVPSDVALAGPWLIMGGAQGAALFDFGLCQTILNPFEI